MSFGASCPLSSAGAGAGESVSGLIAEMTVAIEIVSANWGRVLVDGEVEVEILLRILRGLEALP